MSDINWEVFKIKNPNVEDSFEELCLHLFCREHKINGFDIKSNYNQVGLEIEPQKIGDKFYGFQAKFIEGNSSGFYDQALKSVTKAKNRYSDKLNEVYIFTNLNISPYLSSNDKAKARLKKAKMTSREKLDLFNENYGIKIKFITLSNFKNLLLEPDKRDLYRKYFDKADEMSFLKNTISIEDRTFLLSDKFIDLPLDSTTYNQQKENLLSNDLLLLGSAGSGKTEIMKDLFCLSEQRYWDSSGKNKIMPIFIRLRECANGDIESLIRERLADYYINKDTTMKFIYILDGIDEVDSSCLDVFVSQAKNLSEKTETKSIAFSSRPNAQILSNIMGIFDNKIAKYEIHDLSETDIKKFSTINDLDIEKMMSIYKEIGVSDIFSLCLVRDNLSYINEETTKVDLIKYNIEKVILKNNAITRLNIPIPYIDSIEKILIEISVYMHHNQTIIISDIQIQEIIEKMYNKMKYFDINKTIQLISGMFLDSKTNSYRSTMYSFRHKRYFEYFLYLHIKQKFYDDTYILREENLLHNKDFVLNIFLTQELKENTVNRNVINALMLRFFQDFLGRDYVSTYQNKWIDISDFYLNGNSEEPFRDTSLMFLCQKNEDELKSYITLNRDITDMVITIETFWKFIRIYHEQNNRDIHNLILGIYEFNQEDLLKYKYYEDIVYYQIAVIGNLDEIDNIYNKHYANIEYDDIENRIDYCTKNHHYDVYGAINFFNIVINNNRNWIVEKICDLPVQIVEIISNCLLENKNVGINLGEDRIVKAIINRVEKDDNKYEIRTKVLYALVRKTERYQSDIADRVEKSNINHIWTWRNGMTINNYCAAILYDSFSPCHTEYKLGVDITNILIKNDGENILNKLMDIVSEKNHLVEGHFKYETSRYVGYIICNYTLESDEIKEFVYKLLLYPSVISSFEIAYTVYKNNKDLFKSIYNETYLKNMYENEKKQILSYDELCNYDFMYASMINVFNVEKASLIYYTGFGNMVFRPAYSKENVVFELLPKALEISCVNKWYGNSELDVLANKIYQLLEIAKDTIENGAYLNNISNVVHKYIPNSHLCEKLRKDDKYQVGRVQGGNKKLNISDINTENLKSYYMCMNKEYNFNDITYWKQLIDFEYSIDEKLITLTTALKESHFPNNFSDIFEYFKYIFAVLLTKLETKDYTISNIMSIPNKNIMILMIEVYAILGDEESGRQTVQRLLGLCQTLVCVDRPMSNDEIISKIPAKYKILSKIYESAKEDWIFDIRNKKIICSSDSNLVIVRYDGDEFSDSWTDEHMDKNAYTYLYSIEYGGTVIDVIEVVVVDGGRAIVPMPKIGTKIISRQKLKFTELFVEENDDLYEYIARSGLTIE